MGRALETAGSRRSGRQTAAAGAAVGQGRPGRAGWKKERESEREREGDEKVELAAS